MQDLTPTPRAPRSRLDPYAPHGWFWRNRSNADVTVTLKTNGDYASIKRVL